MVNRVVTGASYGLRDWLVQRVTAVIMAIFSVGFGSYLLSLEMDYNNWTALYSNNLTRTITLLFLLSVYYHAWIGVRDIVMDYIKPASVRLLIHTIVILLLILYSIWSVQILWNM